MSAFQAVWSPHTIILITPDLSLFSLHLIYYIFSMDPHLFPSYVNLYVQLEKFWTAPVNTVGTGKWES